MKITPPFSRIAGLFLFLIVIAGVIGAVSLKEPVTESAAPVFELRSYHIDPVQLDNYKEWISTHGLPYIRKNVDVVGFWVEGDIDSDVSGVAMDDFGPANVTWVIKWASKAERDATMGTVFGTDEWKKVFAKFPGGPEAYLRTEVRFFDGI
ncbi:MAG: hypothetical protein AB8G77_05325 [Rhodothermales bacterium]